MTDPAPVGLTRRLDIGQLLAEAQNRWLRPAEICEILRNYQKFDIQTEAPNRPASGSLFLFDRKVLRYFRKDGHNWRKKKDGKTVKEAHEKLKVGSIDVLHCYYAHGEENENFQRRSYWMLEQELMHIVFVHYLDVKGNRTGNSPINSFSNNHTREPSGNADSTSPTSTLSSGCEEIDSADSYQANSFYQPYQKKTQNSISDNGGNNGMWQFSDVPPSTSGVGVLSQNCADGNSAPISESYFYGMGSDKKYQHGSALGSQVLPNTGGRMNVNKANERGMNFNNHHNENITSWQVPSEKGFFQQSEGFADDSIDVDLAYSWNSRLVPNEGNDFDSFYQGTDQENLQITMDEFLMQITGPDSNLLPVSSTETPLCDGNGKYSSLLKQSLLHGGDEALKKVDSFSRWISKELGDVADLNMRPSSSIPWSAVDCGSVGEYSSLSPSISQDQLFSISDYSPKWAYSNYETEVHIIGTFLKTQQEITKCNWSCMFGEVEVPAYVIADGVLCCRCPPHPLATVPFYITNSNRLACSEVREFDYRTSPTIKPNIMDTHINPNEMELHFRLEKLLSIRSSVRSELLFENAADKRQRIIKVLSIKEEGENYLIPNSTTVKNLTTIEEKKQFLEEQIKEYFFSWLIHKVSESGNGPCVLDGEGQSVLHLASALGYDWAILPIVSAGVSINFRDVNGWTALHWAAFCGREDTVALLVAQGATAGALTDPSEEFRYGRTAADLASLNGHKGIAGFLAESSLTHVLKDLTVNDPKGDGLVSAERACGVANFDELSMKDSLSAVRNATQAASRIYQVYRMHSFQRKKLVESDEFGLSDEHVFGLLAAKEAKSGNSGLANAAALQIQKKYRGWKKRKEFLIIRQRIVKLQAHVRGYQVRKQYKPIIWSVGILEKVILRWRRKGTGLRGFRRDPHLEEEENSYDVLQEGRKQNEQRMQHALTRVKSMLHYPEGRAQYTRLLTVVENFRGSQQSDPMVAASGEDESPDIESLLYDDSLMSIEFE